jgi:hypothetical protein
MFYVHVWAKLEHAGTRDAKPEKSALLRRSAAPACAHHRETLKEAARWSFEGD